MATFEFESNENTATASTGVFNTANGGQLNSTTDVDTFKFVLTEGAALSVKFKMPTGAAKEAFVVNVLDEFGGIVATNGGLAEFGERILSLGSGIYFIQVMANTGTDESGNSYLKKFTSDDYSIEVNTTPSVTVRGEIEGNNSSGTATEIVVGDAVPLVPTLDFPQRILGNLSSVSDKDYFKFSIDNSDLNQTGLYTVVFNAPTDLEPDKIEDTDPAGTIKEFFKISVLNADGTSVLTSHYVSKTPEGGFKFNFSADLAGDYYLLIENGGSTTKINQNGYKFEINPHTPSEDSSVKVTGGTGADYLLGSATSDIITGGAGNDILSGGAGSDSLDGGLGNDVMKGGLGNDIYVVNSSTDIVIENAGDGIDMVYALFNYALAKNVENLKLDTSENTKVTSGTGNALDNVILGNQLANSLSGLDGNDTLDGGTPAARGDTLTGGNGNDVYIINSTLDRVVENATTVSNLLPGTTDSVISKVDILALFANVEWLFLDNVDGVRYAHGNTLNNYIEGNDNDNQLFGKAGDDWLTGRGGNDALDGDAGQDTLEGGSGSDVFIFNDAILTTTLNASKVITAVASNGNVDTIVDFESGVDKIDLSKTIFSKAVSAATTDFFGELNPDFFKVGSAATDANDFIIYDSSNGNLYYDIDGSGSLGQVHFATLDTHPLLGAIPTLTAADFELLIA